MSLLEALVAFVIAALAVAVLAQGSAEGLRSARLAAHYEEALVRARSRLAAIGPALQPGQHSGDDGGGFEWRTSVAPAAVVARPVGGAAGQPVLYQVRVSVAWEMDGGRRVVTLATKRLGEQGPRSP